MHHMAIPKTGVPSSCVSIILSSQSFVVIRDAWLKRETIDILKARKGNLPHFSKLLVLNGSGSHGCLQSSFVLLQALESTRVVYI